MDYQSYVRCMQLNQNLVFFALGIFLRGTIQPFLTQTKGLYLLMAI